MARPFLLSSYKHSPTPDSSKEGGGPGVFPLDSLRTHTAGAKIRGGGRTSDFFSHYKWTVFGTWRSPVAHRSGGAEVAGSNPAVPTASFALAGRRSGSFPMDGISSFLPVHTTGIPHHWDFVSFMRMLLRGQDNRLSGSEAKTEAHVSSPPSVPAEGEWARGSMNGGSSRCCVLTGVRGRQDTIARAQGMFGCVTISAPV